jgi:hypothetical protein
MKNPVPFKYLIGDRISVGFADACASFGATIVAPAQ